jgi:hypothetical protein
MDMKTAMDSHYMACFLVADTLVEATNVEVVTYLAWCGEVLLSGVFPEFDFGGAPWPHGSWRQRQAGKPLAGGYIACLSGVTHDAKARKETHRFVNFYSCNTLCDQCPANSAIPRLSWTNFGDNARWRGYLVDHESYVRNTRADMLSPWCKMPGFAFPRALFDMMHVVHLGVAKDACAQVMHDLCVFGYEGEGTLEIQLLRLWLRYKRWCRAHGIPHSKRKFSPNVIGVSTSLSFPELNGRTKAAHVKPLIHFLAHRTRVMLSYRAEGDTHADKRAWLIYCLADFLYILDHGGASENPAMFI